MPLPVLNKLQREGKSNVLSLEDYKMGEKQVQCLSQVLGMFGPRAFGKVYINNNGLSDSEMAILLEGIRTNKHVSCLDIAFNQLQELAIHSLCKFFEPPEKSIQALSLQGTRTNAEHVDKLCQRLGRYKQLSQLQLQNLKLGQAAIEGLCSALDTNLSLQILNLAWNTVNSKDLLILARKLRTNRVLSQVNLKNIAVSKSCSHEISEHLHVFIRKNSCLLHLDLSYMYMNSEEILHIMLAASKSRTLLSVHLSGNQVDSQDFRVRLRRLLRPRKRLKNLSELLESPSDDDDLHQDQQNEVLKKQSEKTPHKKGKILPKREREMPKEVSDDTFILTRVLGHLEMPKSYKWVESTQCWFCQRHVYTLVLASRSICQSHFTRPKKQERQKYQDTLLRAEKKHADFFCEHAQDYNELPGSDIDEYQFGVDDAVERKRYHKNQVLLASKFSGWRCKSMMPLVKFVELLQRSKQPQLR